MADIEHGDVITDGLVNGKVVGEGEVKFGRKSLPAYKIEIQSGHAKGQTSLIVKSDARLVEGTDPEALLSSAKQYHARRGELARKTDEAHPHQRTLTPKELTAKRVRSWKKRPGSMDIRGVDAPSLSRSRG